MGFPAPMYSAGECHLTLKDLPAVHDPAPDHATVAAYRTAAFPMQTQVPVSRPGLIASGGKPLSFRSFSCWGG